MLARNIDFIQSLVCKCIIRFLPTVRTGNLAYLQQQVCGHGLFGALGLLVWRRYLETNDSRLIQSRLVDATRPETVASIYVQQPPLLSFVLVRGIITPKSDTYLLPQSVPTTNFTAGGLIKDQILQLAVRTTSSPFPYHNTFRLISPSGRHVGSLDAGHFSSSHAAFLFNLLQLEYWDNISIKFQ